MEDEYEEVVEVQAGEIIEPGEEAGSAPEEAPVIAEVRSLQRPGSQSLPAVRAAAVAATGFAAGAAMAVLVRRRSARRLSRRRDDRGDPLGAVLLRLQGHDDQVGGRQRRPAAEVQVRRAVDEDEVIPISGPLDEEAQAVQRVTRGQ